MFRPPSRAAHSADSDGTETGNIVSATRLSTLESGYDAFSCGSQCNEATDPCICLGRIFYILLTIIDVAILFLVKPFTVVKLLQLYSPELLSLLLENNLLKVAVNFGYVAMGSVAKWIIYYLNEDMIKDLHIEVEG